MEELVVLVDDNGRPIGTAKKSQVHTANTPLHLAFSCYIFNTRGEFLLTQRAHSKKVWPGVWTNSVCGHLLPGEAPESAIARRASFELGLNGLSKLTVVLPDYRYKTPPHNGIIENEICPVYVAQTASKPQPNPSEVEAYRWLAWKSVQTEIAKQPEVYSWWFKDQLGLLETSAAFKKFVESF